MEEKLEFRDSPMKTNQIKTILAAWKREARVELSAQEVLNRLTEEYGEPLNGNLWPTIRVFSTEEEVADWDHSHAASSS